MIRLFRVGLSQSDIELALGHLRRALESGYIGEGPLCAELECRLATYVGFDRLLLVNSGTSALRLAAHLCGARPGTEVISTPVTCLATNTAILETGASIVWADVDEYGLISPSSVADKVNSRTVAVMCVDWAGQLCDVAAIRRATRGVSIIEDAAHAFGAPMRRRNDRGDFVAFSFQAIKHFSTGDGGGLVCPGSALAERARLLRWFGLDRTRGDSMRCYQHVAEAGFKMQSNDLAASIGLASLDGVQSRLALCRENAQRYFAELSTVPYVLLPRNTEGTPWWFFPIRVSRPILFSAFLEERGIEAQQVHARNDTNAAFDQARVSLPGVDAFCEHQVNLPVGAHVAPDEITRIVDSVREWSTQPAARW